MSAIITLNVARPDRSSDEYTFESSHECIVGRADDCHIQLPSDLFHADISRHHCVFEIDPPEIRVRDLGSLNGTYVNEEELGASRNGQKPREAALEKYIGRELKDGDQVRLGHTRIRVGVQIRSEHDPLPV